MKILIVGGTGHIGSYLVPRLLRNNFEVSVVSRNCKPRYPVAEAEWGRVGWIQADRREEEKSGAWQKRMDAVKTDVVIDLICFTPEQNRLMMEAFGGRISHFLHCGTLWAYGPAYRVPYREEFPRRPITEYGKQKHLIETELYNAYCASNFPSTVIHPGHISGAGWLPVDPQGTLAGTDVYENLAAGRKVRLPDNGLATLHHVHADDVAQLFERAVLRRNISVGESFSAAASFAMTLVECCREVAGIFGRSPVVEMTPLQDLKSFMNEDSYKIAKTHVEHSPCASIAKARKLLDFQPRYTIPQIYRECIERLLKEGASRTLTRARSRNSVRNAGKPA